MLLGFTCRNTSRCGSKWPLAAALLTTRYGAVVKHLSISQVHPHTRELGSTYFAHVLGLQSTWFMMQGHASGSHLFLSHLQPLMRILPAG